MNSTDAKDTRIASLESQLAAKDSDERAMTAQIAKLSADRDRCHAIAIDLESRLAAAERRAEEAERAEKCAYKRGWLEAMGTIDLHLTEKQRRDIELSLIFAGRTIR